MSPKWVSSLKTVNVVLLMFDRCTNKVKFSVYIMVLHNSLLYQNITRQNKKVFYIFFLCILQLFKEYFTSAVFSREHNCNLMQTSKIQNQTAPQKSENVRNCIYFLIKTLFISNVEIILNSAVRQSFLIRQIVQTFGNKDL